MDLLLYNLLTRFYFLAIRLWAFFDEKARLWVQGRQGIFEKLKQDIPSRRPGEKLVWMHCASLGEFEQGRTVIEALKRERPGVRVLLTFFSPSGFEIRKNYPLADWVFYLPADTKANARRFIGIVQPDLVVFVKYEFWYHFLRVLKSRKIPVILIAAAFREGQPFFRWYGRIHRQMLACFTTIFVQNEKSERLLAGMTDTPVQIAGDPRVDRVLEIAQQPGDFPLIEKFCNGRPVLVCGSTWPADEDVIFEWLRSEASAGWKIILAPHDVQSAHIQQIVSKSSSPVIRFSEAENLAAESFRTSKLLLIDNVGMLARLYRFGRVAYVGGGFGVAIHNTLEPIAFGIPVIFGPRHGKFEEAGFLIKNGGGFSINNATDFIKIMQSLEEPVFYTKSSTRAGEFIRENRGATGKILTFVLKQL